MTKGDPAFNARVWPRRRYEELHEQSLEDPEKFWDREARNLPWFKTWDRVLDWDAPFARWFEGGKINVSHVCLDHHIEQGRGNKTALYWEAEDGESRTFSYHQLHREVNRVASVLKNLDVAKGDRVILYLPMIPELVTFMLACARIGAPHVVVFSGFSAQALADRINDVGAKTVVTVDGAYRRGKVLPLKVVADEAFATCPSVQRTVVIRRTGEKVPMEDGRDAYLDDLLVDAEAFVAPEQLDANDPLFILYTSGTTGKPKGIVHSNGGYITYNHSVYGWVFNTRDDSVFWCTADAGWITGHSYIVYAPLSHGDSIVVYEGAPDMPTPARWWEIIEKYKVTVFYTAPTAIRMFMKLGDRWLEKADLDSLELLGSVGEPINPEAWKWLFEKVGRGKCPLVDTWWQTETGGIMISPAPGIELLPLKPGSASWPMPGIDATVVDDAGKPSPTGEKGHLMIRKPWPGMMLTVYNDAERYKSTYWERFPGCYETGDFAVCDSEGYFWVLGRSDEVLKVAGHRLGASEIESACVSHPAVAESAAVGVPDDIKGESIVVFATLKEGHTASDELAQDLKQHLRTVIGAVATPKHIYFAKQLPKTRSGKIMRRLMKAIIADQPLGDTSTIEDEASTEEVKRAYKEFKTILKS